MQGVVPSTKNSQKFSSPVSNDSFMYLVSYQKRRNLKRSQALETAIKALQEKELAKAYQDQNKSIDFEEMNLWDNTLNDGLDNETW